jgi:integrase
MPVNPIVGMDRPRHRIEPPKQIPSPANGPRDVAIFFILRFTGMRRESVVTLQSQAPGRAVGRMIGCPMLKPHDLRYGVAIEMLEKHHDLEQVRALLGHARIDTTQIYTMVRPAQLKEAVSFYEAPARQMLESFGRDHKSMFEEYFNGPQTRRQNT